MNNNKQKAMIRTRTKTNDSIFGFAVVVFGF